VHGGYLALVRVLGVRTGELHAALAKPSADPAFYPVPVTPADVTGWAKSAKAAATAALDRLQERAATLPAATRADVSRVLAGRETILASFDKHAADGAGGVRMRIHGDYHLGQVLVVQNDFVITDFEGEPARTLAERREKQSPMKDVAGMLRSFDYALSSALLRSEGASAETQALRERLGAEWLQQTVQTFIEGYDQAVEAARLPGAKAHGRGLLQLFLLEKAMYELSYESENRPDWLRVPLRGIDRLLATGT
jgi:maltose alpha-D-glucosyltransferase/alpha-amylase